MEEEDRDSTRRTRRMTLHELVQVICEHFAGGCDFQKVRIPTCGSRLFKPARTDKYYGLRRGRSSARLERRPVTSEVVGSNPIGPANFETRYPYASEPC